MQVWVAVQRAGRLQRGEVRGQLAEHGAQLPAGEVGAEAEVLAEAEREVQVGPRPMSNVYGSANWRSSRLADGYHSVTVSPAWIVVPFSS